MVGFSAGGGTATKLFPNFDGDITIRMRGGNDLVRVTNLIQNAVQFAAREVNITTFWDAATVTIEIGDDGPGFPIHLLGRLGEPYLSTRAGVTDHMGLGIFIAQTLLERSGARLAFDNLIDGGAHVAISWNRANLETVEGARPPAAAMRARRERALSLGWRARG